MVSLTTGIIGIATAIAIVTLIRKDHLRVQYGLWWIAMAGMFALLGLFPTLIDQFAKYLGIAYPPILALTIAIVIVVIKILLMDIEHSRNSINIQRLTQRIALLESDLREMQGKSSEAKPGSNHSGFDDAHQD
ncbi:MAG: DUF2304 domain-containing protein [Gammaproteobacteria bacterium]|nr:DUF2304 domain-containing protein [Gammaproteobacteria bacterium]